MPETYKSRRRSISKRRIKDDEGPHSEIVPILYDSAVDEYY
jgi:hypothetical protein